MTGPVNRTALIIGAGPAGLTAAYEFLDRTDVRPTVLEASFEIGGLSRTAVHRGNRMDIGGHRFFSRSDRVMDWWRNILPLQGAPSRDDLALGREVPLERRVPIRPLGKGQAIEVAAPDPEREDAVMLVRHRLSRILFRRKFFKYPLSLDLDAVRKLGFGRVAAVGLSYTRARVRPIRPERSLEDFFVNRFGRELYETFFRDYTEKVWGVACKDIPPEWGAQRVKGLSISRALAHALKQLFAPSRTLRQRETETSLIERFIYPKLGPGQLWEAVADRVRAAGGEIQLGQVVEGLEWTGRRIDAVRTRDARTGAITRWTADHFVSSMPVKDLVAGMGPDVPERVRDISSALPYRDFLTVGLSLRKLRAPAGKGTRTVEGLPPDNWIYVQESDVKMGRIQIFNNWSPYLVADPRNAWVGLEYFCAEGDGLWSTPDAELIAFAAQELAKLGMCDPADVLDGVVLRVPKAYPAYFGRYAEFAEVRRFTDGIENLYLVGRNGMHRYNNMDHSMLTAMAAVDAIHSGSTSRDALWSVNAEESYHESRG